MVQWCELHSLPLVLERAAGYDLTHMGLLDHSSNGSGSIAMEPTVKSQLNALSVDEQAGVVLHTSAVDCPTQIGHREWST